eukprot:scaffold356_cov69-Phaeocystis_antarctica.AAC.5
MKSVLPSPVMSCALPLSPSDLPVTLVSARPSPVESTPLAASATDIGEHPKDIAAANEDVQDGEHAHPDTARARGRDITEADSADGDDCEVEGVDWLESLAEIEDQESEQDCERGGYQRGGTGYPLDAEVER